MLLDESAGPCDVRWSTLIRMESTDAPTEPQPFSADMMQCPYCGTMLPSNAEACRNCDWTREATKPAEPKASDAMAILLSIIPGLGHIYKGHRIMGAIILFLITPTSIAFAILASIASTAWVILILIPYLFSVRLLVCAIQDHS